MNIRSITIPMAGSATGVASLRVGGLDSVFFCVSANGNFKVQPDSQRPINMTQGQGFGSAGINQYERLTFYNETGADIEVQFFSGDQAFQNTAAVTATGAISVNQKEPSTYFKGSGTLTLALGANIGYSGSDSGKQRKQIVVTNLSATLVLKVRTAAGVVMGTVFPASAWTIESNDTLNIYNPSGTTAVDYEVGQVYYAA